jgi:hypothetical protein
LGREPTGYALNITTEEREFKALRVMPYHDPLNDSLDNLHNRLGQRTATTPAKIARLLEVVKSSIGHRLEQLERAQHST